MLQFTKELLDCPCSVETASFLTWLTISETLGEVPMNSPPLYSNALSRIYFLGVSGSRAEIGAGGANAANLLCPSYFDLFNCPLLKLEVIK